MAKILLILRQIRNLLLILVCFFWLSGLGDSAKSDENNPHTGIDCLCCHSLSKQIDVKRKSCFTCHNVIEENNSIDLLPFHEDNKRQCTDCHTFHEPDYLKANDAKFRFDFSSEISKKLCLSCHSSEKTLNNLSEGHRQAQKVYHSNLIEKSALTPSQTCMVCHGSNYNDYNLNYNNSDMPVINNHASHPYEIEVERGKGNSTNRIRYDIDPEISLFNNRIECQTCHYLNTNNKSLLVSLENQSNFCIGCHEHNGNRIDLAFTP